MTLTLSDAIEFSTRWCLPFFSALLESIVSGGADHFETPCIYVPYCMYNIFTVHMISLTFCETKAYIAVTHIYDQESRERVQGTKVAQNFPFTVFFLLRFIST